MKVEKWSYLWPGKGKEFERKVLRNDSIKVLKERVLGGWGKNRGRWMGHSK